MRSTALLVTIATAALAACESEPPQPQQTNLVNATRSDPAAPSAADGNDIITSEDTTHGGVGNADAGAQQGPPPQ